MFVMKTIGIKLQMQAFKQVCNISKPKKWIKIVSMIVIITIMMRRYHLNDATRK